MGNHLRFSEPIDPALVVGAKHELMPLMSEIDGFEGFHLIQTPENDATPVIIGDSEESLDRVATEFGSQWMRANVLPLLAHPPDRHLGPIITSTQYR